MSWKNPMIIWSNARIKCFDFSDETSLCGVDGCPFGGVCMKDPPSVGGQYQCRCKECARVLGQSDVVCGIYPFLEKTIYVQRT